MRVRRQGMFYQPRQSVLDCPVVVEDSEADWWVARDIQREIARKYRKYVSLAVIGKVAKEEGLVKQTTFGFKLYHKDLVDIIGVGITGNNSD